MRTPTKVLSGLLGAALLTTSCGDKGLPTDLDADANTTPVSVNCTSLPTKVDNRSSANHAISMCFNLGESRSDSTCLITTSPDNCEPGRIALTFRENRTSQIRSANGGTFTKIISSSGGVHGSDTVVSNLPENTQTRIDFEFIDKNYRVVFSFSGALWDFERYEELSP